MTGDLLLAARHLDAQRRPHAAFNGKIDRPRLFGRALSAHEVERLRDDATPTQDGLRAAWDLSTGISSSNVNDVSGNRYHSHTVNMPTRAVTDHTWRGEEMCWTNAPEQYAAIHFHDDDLEDAGWQPSFELTIPRDMRSGVYAVHLEAVGGEDEIPFFVRPRAGTASAAVAFVAPTFSYLAYANERLYWSPGYLEKHPKLHHDYGTRHGRDAEPERARR
ncbi:MAG: hypothetical protein M3336_10685, partial [Chloroflexota bacterium]|nr:hypothetical protein [Chloroflexota bacterium]